MTLAELLVSLAVSGLVMGGVLVLLEEGQRVHGRGAARVEAQQAARIAVERMAREIRQAGAGSGPPTFDPIGAAEPDRIVLHFDHDGDGVPAGKGEVVTWALVGTVLRRNAGAGAQPVVNGVRALRLDYADAAGQPTTDPAAVRVVTITLTTEPAHAPADASRRAIARVTTAARLRNR